MIGLNLSTLVILAVSIVLLFKLFILFSDVHAIRKLLEEKDLKQNNEDEAFKRVFCPNCNTLLDLTKEEVYSGHYTCSECAKQVELV